MKGRQTFIQTLLAIVVVLTLRRTYYLLVISTNSDWDLSVVSELGKNDNQQGMHRTSGNGARRDVR